MAMNLQDYSDEVYKRAKDEWTTFCEKSPQYLNVTAWDKLSDSTKVSLIEHSIKKNASKEATPGMSL